MSTKVRQINKKKKFVADGVFQAELHAFFLRSLNTAVIMMEIKFIEGVCWV
jgi:small subunit ribosomal protein S3e